MGSPALMRRLVGLMAGLALLTAGESAKAQVLTGSYPKKGEVTWWKAYLGWAPSAWFKSKAPLTPELLAQVANRPADSLTLLMPSDYHIRRPNGNEYIRLHLLNPTSQPFPLERADATVLGVSLVVRLDGQWVRPTYPPGSYCGNSFWQDTLAAHSFQTLEFDAYNFYQGTVPVEAKIRALAGKTLVQSSVFTIYLTPLQLYYLRYPRVPLPDIN